MPDFAQEALRTYLSNEDGDLITVDKPIESLEIKNETSIWVRVAAGKKRRTRLDL